MNSVKPTSPDAKKSLVWILVAVAVVAAIIAAIVIGSKKSKKASSSNEEATALAAAAAIAAAQQQQKQQQQQQEQQQRAAAAARSAQSANGMAGMDKPFMSDPAGAAAGSQQQQRQQGETLAQLQMRMRMPIQHAINSDVTGYDSNKPSRQADGNVYRRAQELVAAQASQVQPMDNGNGISMSPINDQQAMGQQGGAAPPVAAPQDIDASVFERIERGEIDAVIMWYTDSCGACHQLKPRYAHAAAAVPDVLFAQFGEAHAAPYWERCKIQGVPALQLWVQGKPITYDGNQSVQSIAEFGAQISPTMLLQRQQAQKNGLPPPTLPIPSQQQQQQQQQASVPQGMMLGAPL
jgi:hypothetical protein